MPSLKGGCACKAVRYEATAEPVVSGACYCRDCQYSSGGGPGYVIMMPRAGVTVTGETGTFWMQNTRGTRIGRDFCPSCGTPLFAHSAAAPDLVSIKPGSLDDPSLFKSQGSVWVASAQPWHLIDQGLPQWDGNPDGPPKG